MAFQLIDSQQVPLSVAVLDKKGNPAKLDGVPEWFVDNTDAIALTPADDGLSCTVKAVGPLTSSPALITFKGDADLGAGITPLLGTFEIEVIAGPATTVTLTPGTPSDQ